MFRLDLLVISVVACANASPAISLKDLTRSKRSVTLSADWATTLKPEANVEGDSCSTLAAITTYNEDQFKAAVLAEHNRARSEYNDEVAGSCPERLNADLEWDSELAKMAQLWANMCTMGHGYYYTQCNGEPNAVAYGQNVMMSMQPYRNAAYIMKTQFVLEIEVSEKGKADLCADTCVGGAKCGHYLQLVEKETTKVGCAFTDPDHACTSIYYQLSNMAGRVEGYAGMPKYAMYVCVYDQVAYIGMSMKQFISIAKEIDDRPWIYGEI